MPSSSEVLRRTRLLVMSNDIVNDASVVHSAAAVARLQPIRAGALSDLLSVLVLVLRVGLLNHVRLVQHVLLCVRRS